MKKETVVQLAVTTGFGLIVELGSQPVLHELAPVLAIACFVIINSVYEKLEKK